MKVGRMSVANGHQGDLSMAVDSPSTAVEQVAQSSNPNPVVPAPRAWLVLGTLIVVYVLNFLCRQLPGILAKPIQDSRRPLLRSLLLHHLHPRGLACRPDKPVKGRGTRVWRLERSNDVLRCCNYVSPICHRVYDGWLRRGGGCSSVVLHHL